MSVSGAIITVSRMLLVCKRLYYVNILLEQIAIYEQTCHNRYFYVPELLSRNV